RESIRRTAIFGSAVSASPAAPRISRTLWRISPSNGSAKSLECDHRGRFPSRRRSGSGATPMTVRSIRDPSLSPEAALRLEEACDRFERAWRDGLSLPITEILADMADRPEAERSAVLRELILIDVEFRRTAGQTPCAQDYREWLELLGAEWLALE